MKVKVITRAGGDEYDYRGWLKILVDGKSEFEAMDGEAEDANLGRDFADCFKIPEMMKAAYDAGVCGESFEIENVEKGWDEEDK